MARESEGARDSDKSKKRRDSGYGSLPTFDNKFFFGNVSPVDYSKLTTFKTGRL